MITSADEVTLRQLVGSKTFARAAAYARGGAVRSLKWEEGGSQVVGEVQGGALQPYRATVRLSRSPSAKLSALQGVCTCPVGVNCKHVVALLLARRATSPGARPLTLVGTGDDGPARAKTASSPDASRAVLPRTDWELPLRALLGGGGGAVKVDDVGSAEIGLQFELVSTRPKSGRLLAGGGAGIRIRPVIPSRSGNWVRTGVSWANLDRFNYGRARGREAAERLSLVKEFLALSRLAAVGYSFGYPEPEVWLEKINSRRIWDLLREARDVELPLVRSVRHTLPVDLRSSPAVVSLDVRRTGEDLCLEPRVAVDDQAVPLASSLLLGDPAHGLAWWGDPSETASGPAPSDSPQLYLAPFATPVDDTLRAFLERPSVIVPGPDEERFLEQFYPTLRRLVSVVSSDESVELPEEAPSALMLTVTHRGGHRVALVWMRGRAGTQLREGLWDAPARTHYRGPDGEMDATLDAVTAIAAAVPGLVETTRWGQRLAPTADLEGISAARFMAEVLPALADTAGLEIDHVGTALAYREVAEAPVVRLNGAESRDGDWFDLTVEVAVGGEDVPFHQLFVALAEGRSHLILPSGTYFSLERDELRQLADLIAEARALRDPSGDRLRLSRFQGSLWDDLCRLGVVTAQAGAWEASVRALSEASDRVVHPTPRSLKATLRPYQEAGFNWLAYLHQHRLGGVLADDMGLGKTLQALSLMCHTKEQRLTTLPYLVVAPTSVVDNWATECRRFAPDLVAVAISETQARRGITIAEMAASADVVITSYALFRLEYSNYDAVEWAGLFLDEAQFAKNRNSKTYQQIKMLPVTFKVAMTGTPMENNLMELWSLLSIAAPGLFPSPDRFNEHYLVPIEKHADAESMDRLRRRVRPLMLRRTKDQVIRDLPDKQEQVLELELNPKHKRLYQTYLARERQKILGLIGDMNKNRFEILRSLTLLRQASLDVSLIDNQHAKVPSTKLDALMEMLDGIVDDGHRVLVFSQFTRFLGQARERIEAAGIEYCYLDGHTRKRPEVIRRFRDGGAPVFLISLKAGGFGLNLTEADYCILLDPWWNPATEAQAVDRIHRIGQTRKVMVYRMVAKDTIEEKVMALKARKAALFANLVDAGGFESGALTAADIRGLLS